MNARTRAMIETTLGTIAKLSADLRALLDAEDGQAVLLPAAALEHPQAREMVLPKDGQVIDRNKPSVHTSAEARTAFISDLESFISKRLVWGGPTTELMPLLYPSGRVPVTPYAAGCILGSIARDQNGNVKVKHMGKVSVRGHGTYAVWAISLRQQPKAVAA